MRVFHKGNLLGVEKYQRCFRLYLVEKTVLQFVLIAMRLYPRGWKSKIGFLFQRKSIFKSQIIFVFAKKPIERDGRCRVTRMDKIRRKKMAVSGATCLRVWMRNSANIFEWSHECSAFSRTGWPIFLIEFHNRLTCAFFLVGIITSFANTFQAQTRRIKAWMLADSPIPTKVVPRYSYRKMLHVRLISYQAWLVWR